MTIYEIDRNLEALINCESGEISDIEAFEALQMEREAKIEGTACFYKNVKAAAADIREEEKALAERRKALEAKGERLQNLLTYALQGSKFETARCKISYRKSTAVEVDDSFVDWALLNADDLLTYTAPKPSLNSIKAALQEGRELKGAALVEHTSIQIK